MTKGEIHIIKSNIRVLNDEDPNEQYNECEEAGCSKKAVMDWNGYKVCNGHYNLFKAREESLYGKGFPPKEPL